MHLVKFVCYTICVCLCVYTDSESELLIGLNSSQGSIPMDAWRQKPEHIVSLGEVVAVATRKGSTVFFFDAQSAHLLRKFDIVPLTRLLSKQN